MLTNVKSHNENRRIVCLFCCFKDTRRNKSKYSIIWPGGTLEERINGYIKYNAICDKCRRKLYRKKSDFLDSVGAPKFEGVL